MLNPLLQTPEPGYEVLVEDGFDTLDVPVQSLASLELVLGMVYSER